MKLLDLFCGAGGAAMGYYQAGFDEIVGVDINPQSWYPFEFVQANAMEYPLDGFDAVHASPPCQAYSQITRGMGIDHLYSDLLAAVRTRLQRECDVWIIENVVGAPMSWSVKLCGSMFGLETKDGLWLRRHRLFECSHAFLSPRCRHPKGKLSIGVYGNGANKWHREKLGRNVTVEEQREAMGIDWMPRKSLSQAIPPAYTKWLGQQFIQFVF